MMKRIAVSVILMLTLLPVAFAADNTATAAVQSLQEKYDALFNQLKAQYDKDLAALKQNLGIQETATPPVTPVATPAPAPAKKPWYDNFKVNGYTQIRFEARDYGSVANERDEFTVRRYYLTLAAPLNNKTNVVATWAGVGGDFREGANADWENVFIEYSPRPEFTIRAGQGPNFFGLDAAESSSIRTTVERALVTEGNTVLGLQGLYAFGPSDRGLWLMYDQRNTNPDKTGLRLVGSVHNGQFAETDKDNSKNISLDAEYYTKWGQFGASWLDGTYTNSKITPSVTADRNAFGLNLRVYPNITLSRWGFQAEWADGEWLGAERSGWYGQASYHFDYSGHKHMAYTRYEQFDPNKDTENNSYKGLHLGYKYYITPQDEVTLEYTDGSLGKGSELDGSYDTNDLAVQYQRLF